MGNTDDMSRPWRIQFENAVYHVTSRGNRKQDIFLDDSDRGYFIYLLGQASSRFQLRIFAFCLMSNHYHLFLQTPLPNLSQSMHWLNCTYACHFGWRHEVAGHLFQGRYKSVLVLDEAHFLHLSMYVHLNPVRALLAESPEGYPWSSFRDYVNRKSRYPWLCRDEILSHYGATMSESTQRYRAECLGLTGREPDFVPQLKAGWMVGPRHLAEELARKYRPPGKIQSVPVYLDARKRKIDPDQELLKVAKIFGVELRKLRSKRRNFPAKLAAYYHLTQHCGISITATAEIMGVSTPAVSLAIRRLSTKSAGNSAILKKISQLSYK